MKKLTSVHALAEFRGSPSACGRQYGLSQAEAIGAFLALAVKPDPARLDYAARCWRVLSEWEPPVVEFVRGMATGTGMSLDEITLLLLHEEVYHLPHCTAFGATGAASAGKAPILAQNWDWDPSLYPWASLLRLRSDATPATLTYAYPGLWAAAGINEHGLALVWTGAGYFPRIRPKVGVPTYALIAGILARRNCREAVALLEKTPNAGAFIFFIGDAEETLGGRIVLVLDGVQHLEGAEPCARSLRRLLAYLPGAMHLVLVEQHRGRIDGNAARSILCDHGVRPGLDICQHPVPGRRGLTLDSFYALPARREFWIARGSPCRHTYVRYTP